VAVIQASLRGKNSRREHSNKQVAHAIANGNADELSRLLSKGAKPVAEALQQAIGSGVPALAEMLVRERSAWGIDAKELAVWAKVQEAIAAAADEDNDEDVDVASEEWQASVAEEVWAGADEAALADAKYAVRQVVELGCYAGERASAPEAYEPAFDSEVSPESLWAPRPRLVAHHHNNLHPRHNNRSSRATATASPSFQRARSTRDTSPAARATAWASSSTWTDRRTTDRGRRARSRSPGVRSRSPAARSRSPGARSSGARSAGVAYQRWSPSA